jgi:hypothetical protein
MMKQILVVLFLVIGAWRSVQAGEFTGAGKAVMDLLERNNIVVAELQRSGHEVISGEFTGAGKRLNFGRVSMLVTGDEVIPSQDVDAVFTAQGGLRPIPRAQAMGDVNSFEAYGKSYKLGQIKGLVIKKLP